VILKELTVLTSGATLMITIVSHRSHVEGTAMTDAELAILSLLAEGPAYDHDLNTAIESRGLRKWTAIGYSSMYYVLDKLERQGLVERLSDAQGQRRFRISAAGVGVLQTAVADMLSTSHAFDRAFELGLANLHVLKPAQVRSALLSRRQDMAVQLAQLHEERTRIGDSFQIEALYAHRITLMESEIAWLDEFAVAWESQAPVEPETVIEPAIIPRIKQVILPQDADSIHKQQTEAPHSHRTPPSMHTMPPKNKPRDDAK
jgi:DNA-binding PadR family transcriptional regulator